MLKSKILLGFELKTGKEVEIPINHTVITGITNSSGKTTAIMGLIKRSGLKALIIRTKIGERAISEGSIIPPYYKDTFDWEYAVELLESSRKEKLKFERSWIIKYSKTANNLLEFKRNIDDALAEGKMRELEKSVLISLQAYLEKILPELQYAPLSKTLDIREGVNIMDLERFKEETQSLIIKSVLEEVLIHHKNTIVVIPEMWRYAPEKLGSPVKRPAEAFIRQGATNNNYLFLDSQDITGVSKTILKQVSNWILGLQREVNEIKRVLDQISLPKKNKPNPEEIATLQLGEFYVVTSEFTKKAYALPSWLDKNTGKNIALGKIKASDTEQPIHIAPYQIVSKSQEIIELDKPTGFFSEFSKKVNELREDFLTNRNDFFTKFQQINETISLIHKELYNLKTQKHGVNEDEIVMRVLQKLPTPSLQSATSVSVNEEEIIKKVLARVPSGEGKVYEIAPLEMIKKNFLKESKEKILADIETLSNDAKKMLKYIESRGIEVQVNELVTKCYMIKAGGYASVKISNVSKELVNIEVGIKTKAGRIKGALKERIKYLLATHEATEQEIQSVYDHILANLLEAKNG